MEKEMYSSMNLLDSIIEQNPHAMWISDENGTLIRLNQACRDLLDLSDEEVVGKYNVLEDNIVAQQGLLPMVKRVFEQGQTVNFTIEYDSSKLDHLELERTVFKILDVTIAPVKDKDGRVTNAVIMHRDVTEHRQAVEALASNQEQIKMIVDTLPVLLAYVDAEQRYLYVNQLYAEWYGLTREKILGKHIRDVLHETTYQKALPAIKAALNGQRITYENNAVYDAQGQPHTVRATYVPHLDENGQAKAFLAMVEDVTEHKQAEKQIQDLARFPAENPNPVLRVSGEGAILYANEASFPLLDAWGCRESRRLPTEWRETVSQSLASGSYDQVETQYDERTLLLSITPVAEAGYANIYGLDITERKQVEERVKHLNAVLRAIRDINQLIVREKNRGSLLQGVCNTLIAARGYYDAWIALLDESGALEAAAEAGLGEDFPLLIERLKQGEPTYCMQKALTQVDILTIENPTSTCIDCPLSNKYGDRAGMAVQLEHAGEAYGLLVVSTSAKIVADKEELELLEEIARDIALALHDIELKEAREQAEEALRQSENKYRTLHESMMDAFVSVDMAGHIVEFNRVYKNILGYLEEELYNLTYVDITPEKWHASEARIVDEQILERGYSDVYEKEYRKKDGTVFPVELRTFLIRDEAGRPTGMWAVVRDITERKRAEVQLAEQLDELRRWHAATLGRETRILDLKHEVNGLLAQAGQPPRYPSAEAEDQ